MLFDSHAHYDDEKFDDDRDKLIKRVHLSGVEFILNVGADIVSSFSTLELTKKYDFIYGAAGVHPHAASQMKDEDFDTLKKLLLDPKMVAVGEIGLDYHYDFSPRDVQKLRFVQQIELAKELKKPIIVHDREANEDCFSIIKTQSAKDVGGVFHCFAGSVEMAKELLKQNFYISIAGPVTFKNAKKTVEVVKFLPDDRILIETDCPYLSPEPNRGKRNDSSLMRYTAERIAEIRGCSFERICELTSENAKKLFGINLP